MYFDKPDYVITYVLGNYYLRYNKKSCLHKFRLRYEKGETNKYGVTREILG